MRWRALAVLLAVCAVGAGSAGSASAGSTTPRVDGSNERLRATLISRAALRSVPGLGSLRRVPLDRVPVYADPDPRAPCGAVIGVPPPAEAAVALFTSPRVLVFELVNDVGPEAARALLDTMLADVRPDCAPFQTTTNLGEPQTVTNTVVELPKVGDQRVGTVGTVEVRGVKTYVGAIVLRRDGLVARTVVMSPDPVVVATLRPLAEALDQVLATARVREDR